MKKFSLLPAIVAAACVLLRALSCYGQAPTAWSGSMFGRYGLTNGNRFLLTNDNGPTLMWTNVPLAWAPACPVVGAKSISFQVDFAKKSAAGGTNLGYYHVWVAPSVNGSTFATDTNSMIHLYMMNTNWGANARCSYVTNVLLTNFSGALSSAPFQAIRVAAFSTTNGTDGTSISNIWYWAEGFAY